MPMTNGRLDEQDRLTRIENLAMAKAKAVRPALSISLSTAAQRAAGLSAYETLQWSLRDVSICFFLRECSAEPHSKKDIYLYLNGSSISGAPAVLAFAKYRSLFLSTNGNCRPIAWITLCVKSFYNDIYPCQVSGLAQAFASHEGNLFDQLAIAQLEFHHGPRVATMPRQRRPAKLSEGPLDFPELGLWTSDPRPRTCRSLPPRSHPALGQARLRGTQEQRNTGPQERRGAGTSG